MKPLKKIKLALALIGAGFGFKMMIYFLGTDPHLAINQSRELFENRCSQCHGINEANNMDSYLPSSIQKTVERMQHKSDSGISSHEAEQIYEYLVYEYSTKYPERLHAELQALPEEERKKEQAKINHISSKFNF